MKENLTTKSILHHLGIGKSYSGYNYILYAIELLFSDSDFLNCITKILYVEVACKYHTSSTCVERNIRKVIEIIWKNSNENAPLIACIFGERYVAIKPTNKEFLEMLYEYVKSDHILQTLLSADSLQCPITHKHCEACEKIIKKFINLN